MMKRSDAESSVPKVLLLGGLMFGAIALLLDGNHLGLLSRTNGRPENCDGVVNDQAVISREQLASFLTISERDAKTKVQEILKTPYCQLAAIEVRAGVKAERDVYPLAFDPHTRLIVLYEGDEYAGYQFQFEQ